MSAEVERIMELVDRYAFDYDDATANGRAIQARAAIRAALLAVVSQWLPISEAPRDGTLIIVPGNDKFRVPIIWWGNLHFSNGCGWVDSSGTDIHADRMPTLWQPLPTPPAPGGEQ